jgi:hypothetical protein
MGHAPLHLGSAALGVALLAASAEIEARDEVQEILPRAFHAALAESRQLQPQRIVLVHLLDERHQLALALAGDSGDDVDQAVAIRAYEIERALGKPFDRKLGAYRRPPAPRQTRVAGVAATEHPNPQRQPLLADQPHPFRELLAPRVLQPTPVIDAAAELSCALLGRDPGLVGLRPAGGPHPNADLVPLDLERDQRGHEVVDVRRARHQHRERALAAVIPSAPSRRRLRLLPRVHRDPVCPKRLDVLPHHDEVRSDDAVGEPADPIQERPEVEFLARGERVQARAHCAVGGLQHPKLRLAARAQQRVVGPLIELDLVAEADLPVRERCQS